MIDDARYALHPGIIVANHFGQASVNHPNEQQHWCVHLAPFQLDVHIELGWAFELSQHSQPSLIEMKSLHVVAESGWVFLSGVVPRQNGIGVEKRAWAHLTSIAALRPPRVVLALSAAQLAQEPDFTFLRPYCESVHVVPLASSWRGRKVTNTPAFIAQRVLLWGRPSWTAEPGALSDLRDALVGGNLEGLFCFRLACFELWRQLCNREGFTAKRVVVDFDDIESIAMQRMLLAENKRLGVAHSLAARLEIAERRRLETLALKSHDVLVCSTVDAARLLERNPNAVVSVIPNAYPLLAQLPPARRVVDQIRLLLVGTLSYAPNIDAAEFLIHELLPELRKAWYGQIRISLVGRRPDQRVLALHQPPEIEVQADVQDIAAAYEQADVVVVPIRFGGGTRIKILEALSLGRPVVSTSIGAEGLDLRHGKDILIADTPADFAHACVRISQDGTLANNLVFQGRKRFVELYGEGVVRERLRDVLVPHVSARTPI